MYGSGPFCYVMGLEVFFAKAKLHLFASSENKNSNIIIRVFQQCPYKKQKIRHTHTKTQQKYTINTFSTSLNRILSITI